MAFLLKCHEASIISSEKLDRKLSPLEWWSWCLHVVRCPACRLFHQQVKLIQRMLSHDTTGLRPGMEKAFEGEELTEGCALSEEAKKKLRELLSSKL